MDSSNQTAEDTAAEVDLLTEGTATLEFSLIRDPE
jgi:lipid A disaccharide synthetase